MKLLTHFISVLAIIAVCFSTSAQAQTTQNYDIKGIAVDSATMNPIGFATVILKDSTATLKAVAADADGKFSVKYNKAGTYTLQITFVGYIGAQQKIVLKSNRNIDLGKVRLSSGVEIGEVVVVGQLITSDIDKTTYHTALDPETPSLTALELLRKVPMLSVDGEDNLQLKGQENYKILVNGKSNTLMSKNYKDVLRSMPASSIKNVEVITNPPMKYDAEGIAGIINIVTERKTSNGYNGSLSTRGDMYGGWGVNGYIAASLGKVTLSANYGTGEYKRPRSTSSSSTVNELSDELRYTNQNGSSKNNHSNHNMSFDMSYEIDTFNLVSMSFWGYVGKGRSNSISNAEYLNADGEFKQGYVNNTRSDGSYGGFSGNIDWQRTFKKPDKTLTMSYRMDLNPGSNGYLSELVGSGGYPDRFQRSDNKSHGGEHTFQVDYFDPLTKKHNIEFGAKFMMRPNTSNTFNETFDGTVWLEDLERKNDLDYMQYITSAYGGYQLKLEKFSAKGGFRAEYTINTGTFKLQEDHKVFNRYFNVVPYITTSYKFNEAKNIRLGYTQRLQRPGIWYLNPYYDDENPMSISTGNPNLDSEIRHTFDLNFNSFAKGTNYGFNLSANFGNNAIENVSEMRDDGSMFSTYENCGRRQNYSLYSFGGIDLLKGKVKLKANFNVSYAVIKSIYNAELNNEGFTFGGGGTLYVQTWKNASVNAFANYWSSRVGLQSKSSGMFHCNFSLSQSLLKDNKLRLNAGVTNPFTKNQTHRSDRFGVGYRSTSEFVQVSRRANFSVQWNFGKMMTQVKKAKRGINNEDKMDGGEQSGATAQ